MNKLHRIISLTMLMLSAPPSQGMELEKSDLPIKQITVSNTMAKASPEFSIFSVEFDPAGDTYITLGLGIEKFGIPESPIAGIWKVQIDHDTPNLLEIPVADGIKHQLVPYTFETRPITPGCGDSFIQECFSLDKRIKIEVTFAGESFKKKQWGGLFSGQTSKVEFTYHNGIRRLSITDNKTGKRAVFQERLSNTAEYSAFGNRLVYLPKEEVILFFPPLAVEQPTFAIILR